MKIEPHHIAEALEYIRNEKQMTLKEVCRAGGISESTMSAAEDFGRPKMTTLLKVCAGLGVLPSTVFLRAERIARREQDV